MKISRSTESTTQPGEDGVGIGNSSRAGHDRNELDGSKIDGGGCDDGEFGDNKVGKKVQKSPKSKKTVGSDFLTPGVKVAFAELKQAFVITLILQYLDPKCHIWIETDKSGHAIDKVFSQLTFNNLGQ